jgi:hypothetical protein
VAELDPTYQFRRTIETVITGIRDSLTEIQRSVQRFEDLPTRTQWAWERHDATSDEIGNLQKMLDSNFRCLTNLNTSLSRCLSLFDRPRFAIADRTRSYSQTAIISKLEKFFRDVQCGSRQESRSSLDSLSTDEAEAWRMVRKHLEDVGITPQLFDQHHTLIKDSILEAMVSGKLDEVATEDQREEEAVGDDDACRTEIGGIYLPHHNSAGFSFTGNISPESFNLDDEGTPQLYGYRIMDDSDIAKQLQSQSESLRGQSFECREERTAATRISTAGEDSNSATAEGAIPESNESFWVNEKAPLPPVTKCITALYHTTPDLCQQYALVADCPVILSYEEAKSKLKEEQEMCWEHLQQPKRRQAQLRTSQNKTKFKRKFCLETAEDYHIYAHEVRNRRKGLKFKREGRFKKSDIQPGMRRI